MSDSIEKKTGDGQSRCCTCDYTLAFLVCAAGWQCAPS